MYFLHTLKLSVWTLRCLHDRTQAKAMKQSARFHRHQNRAPSWRPVDGETGPKWPLRWQAWQTRRNMKMWYTFHISFYIIFLLLVTNYTIISINTCTNIYTYSYIHDNIKYIVKQKSTVIGRGSLDGLLHPNVQKNFPKQQDHCCKQAGASRQSHRSLVEVLLGVKQSMQIQLKDRIFIEWWNHVHSLFMFLLNHSICLINFRFSSIFTEFHRPWP